MATSGPVTQTVDVQSRKWKARPGLALFLRVAITVLPFVAALFFSLWARQTFPPERVGVGRIVWIGAVWLLSMLVLVVADRMLRRFLPLSALFKLSLIFPDKAPQRFSVALRTGTTRQLQRRIDDVTASGIDSLERDGASQLLELVAALGVHDRLTRGHCERVRAYTDLIAEEMGLAQEDRSKLHWAAMLHDVGKLAVPFDILNSTERPTQQDWEILQSHTTEGAAMAEPLRPWLGEWVEAIRSHHERWDGNGYPDGLKKTEIPLGARIVAVADAFDVMTSKRSYKEPIPVTEARAEIAECAGGQFDPDVARAFLEVGVGQLRLVMGPLSWLTSLPGAGGSATTTAVSNVAVAIAAVGGAVGTALPVLDAAPPELALIAPETAVVSTTVPPATFETNLPASTTSSSLPTTSTLPSSTTTTKATISTSTMPTTRATTTTVPATAATPVPTGAAVATTVPPTTAAPTTTVPTTTAPPTTAPPTTPAPVPVITADATTQQWIVNGDNQALVFSSTVAGTWEVTGLPTWISVVQTSTRLELIDNSAAQDRNSSASMAVGLVSSAGKVSNSLAADVSVRSQGLSERAFDIQITELTDYEVAGATPEFVELTNHSTQTISLDGLTLRDDPPGATRDRWPLTISLDGISIDPGKSTVLWINNRRKPGVTGGHLFSPPGLATSGNFLQSGGDELWLHDADGLVVDYLGWSDPDFGEWNQFVGSPAPYLGFCPNSDCYRVADFDAVTAGWSWKRAPNNPMVLVEGPSDPTVN